MDTTEHEDTAPVDGGHPDPGASTADAGAPAVPPSADAAGTLATPAAQMPTVVKRRRKRSWPRRVAWIAAVPLALVLLVVAAWGIDTAISGDDVARNTELAGTPVGGMDEAELEAAVADLASELPDTEVVIDTGDLTLTTTAGDLGLGIDTEATAATVMATGSEGSVLTRPFEWAGSFLTPRAADVAVSVDEATMEATLAALEGEERTAPVEPQLVVADGAATLAPGVDGIELQVADVVAAVPESLGDVNEAITIEAERTVLPPATEDEVVQALVDQANTLVERTVEVTSGEQTFELSGASLMPGVSVVDRDGELGLTISEEVIGQQVAASAEVGPNPTGVKFTSGGGGLVPQPGRDAAVCCGEGAVDAILFAMLAGSDEVEVPSRTISAAEGVEWASGLGVNQVVAEFTTNHPCCQGRVGNIHAIADQLRGTLIAPGETFSVNRTTGERTTDKGYVAAPAIVDGEYVQDVGGGVSQFATTLFNAAFFAGVPIPEYKMHSEYISRYPYAREATLFYSSVDLKIRNDTPYGIVIWPTYTGTSITVQLWSTPYAKGEETGKSQTSGCGTVRTERTITYPDRPTATDTFRANYRCT